jgi:hypothetical protein
VAIPEKAVLDMVYFGYSPPDDIELNMDILSKMAENFSMLKSPRARRVAKWISQQSPIVNFI